MVGGGGEVVGCGGRWWDVVGCGGEVVGRWCKRALPMTDKCTFCVDNFLPPPLQ